MKIFDIPHLTDAGRAGCAALERLRGLVWLLSLLTFLGTALGALPRAAAHQTATSTAMVLVHAHTGQVEMLLSVPSPDLAHYLGLVPEGEGLGPARAREHLKAMRDHVAAGVEVRNEGKPCTTTAHEHPPLSPVEERVDVVKRLHCPLPMGEVEVFHRVMLDAPLGYRHLGRIQLGEEVMTTVFDPAFPSFAFVAGPGTAQVDKATAVSATWDMPVRFAWQGLWHILIGADHVLFVLCLLFGAQSWRALLVVISAFTLGHSLTLGLGALGWATAPEAVVEPLIAASIAWTAWQNLRTGSGANTPLAGGPAQRQARGLGATALAFGLVHGFGFSYLLREELALPAHALVPALLAFNVGVEAGQLAIVAIAYPLILWARAQGAWVRINRWSMIAVLVAALYWVVTRLWSV